MVRALAVDLATERVPKLHGSRWFKYVCSRHTLPRADPMRWIVVLLVLVATGACTGREGAQQGEAGEEDSPAAADSLRADTIMVRDTTQVVP